MQTENIINHLNIIASSAAGIAGAVTGTPFLQVCTYLPAVACAIYEDVCKKNSENDNATKAQLRDLVNETWELMEKKLPHETIENSGASEFIRRKIDECFNNDFSLQEFLQAIGNDLDRNFDDESCNLLEKIELQRVVSTFTHCFSILIINYPDLEMAFNRLAVADLEARVSELEKAVNDYIAVAGKETDRLTECVNNTIEDDSEYYLEKYEEVLFLHRDQDVKMSLKDIFILPDAEIEKGFMWLKRLEEGRDQNRPKIYGNILDAIKDFLNYQSKYNKVDIFFIEGKAAMGKSSLVSRLCWLYKNKRDCIRKYIGDREMLVIKLRDLPDSINGALNMMSPFSQLRSYLLNISENETMTRKERNKRLREIFQGKLLILEGFDELCMTRNLLGPGKTQYFQNFSRELAELNCDCKVIVTSRPEYLRVEMLDLQNAHVMINPFNERKRESWISRYEKKQEIKPDLKNALSGAGITELEGIIDSPLTLYMIAARNINITEHSGLWDIYSEIFDKEVYKRKYASNETHAIYNYHDQLYQLTAEIANTIIQKDAGKLITIGEIDAIMTGKYGKGDIQTILKDSLALTSYFRTASRHGSTVDKENPAVEFYHNNIRDFFYCEYIWKRLKKIYSSLPEDTHERDAYFLASFQEMFQSSAALKDGESGLHAKPIDFMISKVTYQRMENKLDNFVVQELDSHYFRHFFGEMLKTGFLSKYEYTGQKNAFQIMACVFSSVYSVYHAIYLASGMPLIVAEKRQIPEINANFVFQNMLFLSDIHDFRLVDFSGIMFSAAKFNRHNFQNASFQGCLMTGCDFLGCDLRGADFRGASLQRADFRFALIDETTLFSPDTEFQNTLIMKSQRQFFQPWLEAKSKANIDEDLSGSFFRTMEDGTWE